MSNVFDVAKEREECLHEKARLEQKYSQAKATVSHFRSKKFALREQGESTGRGNKKLSTATAEVDNIRAELTAIIDRIRYCKSYAKNNRSLSDHFMDACRRDLDEQTFMYLIDEAKKLSEGVCNGG